MTIKKRIISTLVISLVHFILTLAAILTALGGSMTQLDNPDYQFSLLEKISNSLVDILIQPGLFLSDLLPFQYSSNITEWLLMAFSSLLWGAAITLVIHTITKKKKAENQ